MTECIFCKIINGAIPSSKLYEDDRLIAIRDIRPQAKVHLLVVPKQHVVSLEEAYPAQGETQAGLIGALFQVGTELARKHGLLPGGFRSIINTGRDGGQTVFHLHLHILGGETLQEQLC